MFGRNTPMRTEGNENEGAMIAEIAAALMPGYGGAPWIASVEMFTEPSIVTSGMGL